MLGIVIFAPDTISAQEEECHDCEDDPLLPEHSMGRFGWGWDLEPGIFHASPKPGSCVFNHSATCFDTEEETADLEDLLVLVAFNEGTALRDLLQNNTDRLLISEDGNYIEFVGCSETKAPAFLFPLRDSQIRALTEDLFPDR